MNSDDIWSPSHDAVDAGDTRDSPAESDDTDHLDPDARPTKDAIVPDPKPTCANGWTPPNVVANLASHGLPELSGMVASHAHSDLLWMHNDSGGEALIHPVIVGEPPLLPIALPGVDAVDFEDIARSRCPHTELECLWVADIGNNLLDRDELVLIRLLEPSLDPERSAGIAPEDIASIRFRYPDEPVNAEALFVDPDGTTFWILEKTSDVTVRLFRGDASLVSEVQTLVKIGTLQSPGMDVQDGLGRMITGADMHPAGERVVIRTYTGSFEYVLPQPSAVDALVDAEPHLIAWGPLAESQGEAIAYAPTGDQVFTASENLLAPDPSFQPLHAYSCQPELD
jgi:hypothetical protein